MVVMMISKKKLLVLMMIGVLAVTVSCSSSKNDKDEKTKDDYSVKISDADMDGDHIKLELSKKVTVDADITPISKYKDGLDSYYTKYVGGDNELTYKNYKKTPVFLNNSVKDLMKIIEDSTGGKFTKKNLTTKGSDNYFSGEVSFLDKDKRKGSLSCHIEVDKNHKVFSESAYFMACEADWDKDGNTSDSLSKVSLGRGLLLMNTGIDESDLSFGTKADIGEKMSGLMKDITKTENYNDYRCVVLNEKTFSYILENESLYKDIAVKPLDTEYYIYFFPYKIGDFEWHSSEGLHFFSDSQEREGLEFAEDVRNFYDTESLYPLNASEQAVACNANGVAELELFNTVELTDKYKEEKNILPLNDVVGIVQEYFNETVPRETTIYNIKICYTGMYSSPEDGKIRNIAQPCWCVEYTQGSETNQHGALLINVSTGDIYE